MMISWGGITFCASGVTLYCWSRKSGRDAAVLRSVQRVNRLKDLAVLLESGCETVPLVVTVAGRVGSEMPISCEHSSLRCVILEETTEQHFLKHNESGSWIQDSAVMVAGTREEPWYLEDGTGHAYIIGGRGASGFQLTVASEVFEESGHSLVCGTLDYLQGLKMLGVKKVERVLPIGMALTVVGEAVKDDIGNMRIERPHRGPFYVSPKSIDQLIANLGKWSRWYKYMSIGCTAFGIYLLTSHAIKYFLEERRRAALHKRVMEAAAQRCLRREQEGDGEAAASYLDNDMTSFKQGSATPDLCVICLDQEYNAVFMPCGHMCCCTSCCNSLVKCPLCRRRIEQAVRTYRH